MSQQVSPKVTQATLDTMYNNFVKMTDWVIKGTASTHPMPKAYAQLWQSAELMAEQSKLITQLQARLTEQAAQIEALQNAITVSNQALNKLMELAQQRDVAQAQAEPEPQLALVESVVQEPEPAPVDDLVDLDTVFDNSQNPATNPKQVNNHAEAPHYQPASLITAEQIIDGDLLPAEYAAINAEIDRLLR